MGNSVKGPGGKYVFVHPIERFHFFNKKAYRIERAVLCTRASARSRLSVLPGWQQLRPESRREFIDGDAFLVVDAMNGFQSDVAGWALRYGREVMSVLACAMLYWAGRHPQRRFGLSGDVTAVRSDRSLVAANEGGPSSAFWTGRGAWLPTQFEPNWDHGARRFKFSRLFGVRGSGRTTRWEDTLWRVAGLIGRSQQAESRTEAFLLLMMALDALLLVRRDKADTLAMRIEGLFGGTELKFSLRPRVLGLYEKRCDIVHDGRSDVVEPLDLHHLDFIAANAFQQVWRLRKWSNKGELLKFADSRAAAGKWKSTDRLELWPIPYMNYDKMAP